MNPSSWPVWLRETLPGWAVLGILLWFGLQRLVDRGQPVTEVIPVIHRHPVRDWRILIQTAGFGAGAVLLMFMKPADLHASPATQLGLAVITIVAASFTLMAAYVKSPWWTIGLELVGCVLFAWSFGIYIFTFNSALMILGSATLALGNVLRAIELLRQVR